MSAAMTNIGRDNADANYRYKMPVLQTKVEGRGNGIKTVITNMVDIARALHIHPAYPTKFFGIELGAQSRYNVSTERAIVNGHHQAVDLSKILDRFIQGFILCPGCKLPELKMIVKSTSIKIECAACGHASQIKSAHRLVGYMTKNPPKSFTEDGGKDKKKKKGDKEDELDDDAKDLVAAKSSSSAPDAEADGAEETEKEKKKKAKKLERENETPEERAARKEKKKLKKEKKEKKEKKAKKADKKESEEEESESEDEAETKEDKADKTEKTEKTSSSSTATKKTEAKEEADEDEDAEDDDDAGSEDGTDDWHMDTSKAAVKKRQEAEFAEMLGGAKKDVENLVLAAKADNKSDSAVTVLKIFLASKTRTPSEINAELRRLAMSRGLDEPQKLKILLEAIIDISTPKTVVSQFESKAELLKYFTTQSTGTSTGAVSSPGGSEQKNLNAPMLLTCIEDLIGVVERKLLPYAPMILKTLYETDVLEESTLIAWFDAPPEASWLVNKDVAAEVRAKAKPFIDWLKTAEEEDEDEE